MSKKTKLTLIVAGSLLLLVIVIGTILAKSFPANTNKQNNDNNPPSLVKKEEFIKDLSEKEQIHYKIINSIDFFNTAVGEFEKVDVSANKKTKVSYTIDVQNRKGYIQLQGDESLETIIKDGKKLEIDNAAKSYKETVLNLEPRDKNLKLLAPKDRYSEDKGFTIHLNSNSPKDEGFDRRKDAEFLSSAAESLFNQDYMVAYLRDYDKWKIEGSEVFLERDCVKITGDFGYISKYGASKFLALVDKNTGIILKFQTLTDGNIVIDFLETKSIRLDTAIDGKVFEKDLKDYKKE